LSIKYWVRVLVLYAVYCVLHVAFDSTLGWAQTDAIAAERVQFVGPGGDIGRFPITTAISRVDVTLNGVEVQFDKRDAPKRWPNTCGRPLADPADDCKETRPDGSTIDMGALQYSLGLVLNVGGQWYASAPIETWLGNNTIGGQIQQQNIGDGRGQIAANWFYDGRWGPLAGYNPKPGEVVGLFVVAGDARNNVYRVQERSNIVTFPLPPSHTAASFTFAADGGESIQDTLVRVRNTYPSLITADQAAAVLNETAYLHRTEGWALLGKSAGNNCGQPKTGTRISCDYLIQ